MRLPVLLTVVVLVPAIGAADLDGAERDGLLAPRRPGPTIESVVSRRAASPTFEPNVGQFAPAVSFVSRPRGGTAFLRDGGTVVFSVPLPSSQPSGRRGQVAVPARTADAPTQQAAVLALEFEGARPDAKLVPARATASRTSYFVGRKRSRWRTGVRSYAEVRARDLYPGIDAVFRGAGRHLRFDLAVAPGAATDAVGMRWRGADSLELSPEGDLLIRVGQQTVVQRRPACVQQREAGRVERVCSYDLAADGSVRLRVKDRDVAAALIVDPTIELVQGVGGSSTDSAEAIALGPDGLYVAGLTSSSDFPTTYGIVNGAGAFDAFLVVLSRSGQLLSSTIIGGSAADYARDVAVDSSGWVTVVGETNSADFPVVSAMQPQLAGGGRDAFVLRMRPRDATLAYATYLGGSGSEDRLDSPRVGLLQNGSAVVAGTTTSSSFAAQFPNVDTWGSRGWFDAYVAALDTDGKPIFLRFIGGAHDDEATGIAVKEDRVFLTGITESAAFPVNAGSRTAAQDWDGFVLELSRAGKLRSSTLFGGSGIEWIRGISLDSRFNPVVVGMTLSPDYPRTLNTKGAIDPNGDVFVTKLDWHDQTVAFSATFGGQATDGATAVALDWFDAVHVVGYTTSGDFPIVNGAPYKAASPDMLMMRLNPDGTIGYSAVLPGSDSDSANDAAVDREAFLYVAGFTRSPELLTAASSGDAIVLRVDSRAPRVMSLAPWALSTSAFTTVQLSGLFYEPATVTATNASAVLLDETSSEVAVEMRGVSEGTSDVTVSQSDGQWCRRTSVLMVR